MKDLKVETDCDVSGACLYHGSKYIGHIEKRQDADNIVAACKGLSIINITIAETIMLAQKLHEESYEIPAGQDDGDFEGLGFGGHTRSQEDCWIEACKTKELPDDLWYVLHLANHWYNDLQGWAECILAGGTFTKEISEPITEEVAITDEKIPDGVPVAAPWITGGD